MTPIRCLRSWVLVGGLLAAVVAQASPITSFTVTGQVGVPQPFAAADLAALPQTRQSVTFRAGSTTRADTFTGPLVWDVLQRAGGVVADTATRNGVLRNYVVATGSDGYTAVLSLGEIAPTFGNTPAQVATAAASGTLPDPDGFGRITVPGDVRGGRYVSNLANLNVVTAPLQPGSDGGPSTSLVVRGDVQQALSFDEAALRALPANTQTVTYLAGSTQVTNTFTGALLWDVLNLAGLIIDTTVRNDLLNKVVIATGSDGYQAAFALGELSPAFGNAPILVAYDDVAGALDGGDGFARIVAPGDVRGGRYVSNLISFTVIDATPVPEPGTLAIMLFGLAVLWAMHRRVAAG
jgi:hypothetical protein